MIMSETVRTRSGREFILPTLEEDARIIAAATSDPDARPFTDAELIEARAIRRSGRPLSAAPKIQTAIRFDPDVLAGLRATGRGWQTRVNDTMRDWLKTHSA
jgi:uncharacterized protein (DUF4415 family)